MSIKSKVLAIAASAAVVAGAGAVTATTWTANAATPSCGATCVSIFSHEFGDYANPAFVGDVFRQGIKTGQPVILWPASNADPAEDFTLSFQGLVSDFYAAGLVSSAVNLHYGGGSVKARDEAAFEIEYAPYGVDSGLCMGVPLTAFQDEGVSLQPCGVTSRTVWIWDTYDQPAPWQDAYNGFTYPAINGSDTNFSHPFVLTYPSGAYPTDKPRARLKVTNLTGFSNGFGPVIGQVPDTQLWGGTFGELK